MSACTRRGRVKCGRKVSTSRMKRVSARPSRIHGVDDAVNALRKEVESLRLELARGFDVTRVNESSWQVANESSASRHQVSRTLEGSSSVGMVSVDPVDLRGDPSGRAPSGVLSASVAPEERRAGAYVWRFGARSRAMVECGPLKAHELKTAKLIWMRSEQRVYFSQEVEALSRSGQTHKDSCELVGDFDGRSCPRLEVSLKRSHVKRYGLIFTCLTTRAAHLEVTYTMDVHSFIRALRRFIARRGCPSTTVSDNAETFVGTNALQQEEQLDRFLADRYINWKFNPPGGPHHDGAWERLMRWRKRPCPPRYVGTA
ncbi:hypothetical protein D918_02590 [Trichuris suis]|nr:hypothetical protein D918_02590 [Trichuris suis]